MDNNFEFYTGLRGCNVYSNTVRWKPYVGQKITLKRDHNNPYNKFAATVVVVGHIPRELSRYIWFSIGEGAKFEAEVHKGKLMPSPLVQACTRCIGDSNKGIINLR